MIMKTLTFILLTSLTLISCSRDRDRVITIERKIDSLEKSIAVIYKPGLGEFMSGIQVHHAKLWFAGINQNWELADFEIHEIKEICNNIITIVTDRKESPLVAMLDPALDSVNFAILHKDPQIFKNSFIFLTNTCNTCHHDVHYEFNAVKIPDTPPFSNQVFTKGK
jgi:hypothetical protein